MKFRAPRVAVVTRPPVLAWRPASVQSARRPGRRDL